MHVANPVKRRLRRLALGLAALLANVPAPAQVAVLVHGYLGDRDSWREAGVTAVLESTGWRDGGAVVATARGLLPLARGPAGEGPVVYTVELPSEAPVLFQARVLGAALQGVTTRHPEWPPVLVGHSAGGVVARAWLVTQPDAAARALVTVASPHLGTDRAGLGLAAGHSPLGMMAPFLGLGSLNRSQGLYADLTPERPGNFLFWLNRQPHPQAVYVSLVRPGDDPVVPTRSQHLGNVAALAGRARSLPAPGGHLLGAGDGARIARVLGDLP